MAEPKKVAAKKTVAKKADAKDDLATQLAGKLADLQTARASHKSGELVNPRVLGTTRKEIARLKTAMRIEQLTERKK